MTAQIISKIDKLEASRKDLDKSSQKYMQVGTIIDELKKLLPKSKVKLHVAEEAHCDGCQ